MSQRTTSRQWTFEEALGLVCDAEQELSRTIIALLSGLSRAEMGRLAECWPSMPPDRRRELISTMVDMAEADFELDYNSVFRWAMRSEDPVIRERAVEGLWEDDQPALIEPLIRLMEQDPEASVRARAATSLGRFALLAELGDLAENWAGRIRKSLLGIVGKRDEAPEVRRRAIESVAYMSDAPVREIIDEAYASPNEEMRISAVFAMGHTADPHWAAPVLAELQNASPAMRYEAARAAGEIALRPAIRGLIALLDDRDAEVRQMAIWALGQIGGKLARRALEKCQASPDEAVREAAEEAMAELDFASAPLDLFRVDAGDLADYHEEDQGDEALPGDAL